MLLGDLMQQSFGGSKHAWEVMLASIPHSQPSQCALFKTGWRMNGLWVVYTTWTAPLWHVLSIPFIRSEDPVSMIGVSWVYPILCNSGWWWLVKAQFGGIHVWQTHMVLGLRQNALSTGRDSSTRQEEQNGHEWTIEEVNLAWLGDRAQTQNTKDSQTQTNIIHAYTYYYYNNWEKTNIKRQQH